MPGGCHYLEGNANAKRRVKSLQELLPQMGLEPERVRMFNMSAAMANEFVAAATEMVQRVSELGPSPLRSPAASRVDARRGE